MIVFPNAKINLGLRILGKRPDGYHNLQSYMIPVEFSDALELVPSVDFEFNSTGLIIDIADDENICVKAFRLMERTYNVKPVKIHLHKIIPTGSGLGGGSSNGAFTLTLLRKLYNLKLCNDELEIMAAMLGSDCPFFIVNKPQLVEQTGKPTHKFLRLPPYHIVIVIPPFSISTAHAYSLVKPSGKELPDASILLNNESNWPDLLVNDFEEPLFSLHPQLPVIKKELYNAGAFYASMSGSGSAVYGLFHKEPDVGLGCFMDRLCGVD
jgi:4-diphosphocytidyl-2-C-methyl-D-erythritol kinase